MKLEWKKGNGQKREKTNTRKCITELAIVVKNTADCSIWGASKYSPVVNYPKNYRLKSANNYYLSFWGLALSLVPLGHSHNFSQSVG